MTDPNQDISSVILDLAEVYRPTPRYWGYKRASRAIRRHPEFLTDLTDEAIRTIPGVGTATLRIVREMLESGRSLAVERIVTDSGKRAEIEQHHAMRQNFLSAAMVRRVLAEPASKRAGSVRREDYCGDLQMHSTGSHGADGLAALAEACIRRGYGYMAVTDHSYGLPIAGGMSIEKIRAQRAEVAALNRKYGVDFRVFQGIEANIQADGRLDMQAAELQELDLVFASPHSRLRKTIDQTERMLTAVSSPGVHILGHPRGRIFNLRHGVVADWPAVFTKAAAMNVAVEIDGDVSRQDIDFRMAIAAKKADCLFALDSDAHAGDQLWMADYAIAHARLAGIPPERIVNCWRPSQIMEWAARAHVR